MAADGAVRRAVDAAWRNDSARLVASVARIVRDVGLAEELAQDALVAALEHWPRDGIPDNPAAWLMTVARRRAFDRRRHAGIAAASHDAIGQDLQALGADLTPDVVDTLVAAEADPVGDDLLRLIFTACHPVLSTDARVALTLKLLCGLGTGEIARACLVSEPAMAQRIVRAKRTLSTARVPYELPPREELGPRLASVLEVVYLVFNEGYAATRGEDWLRPALCDEAIRLGRLLAELAPAEPEAYGLLALMELQASRTAARTGPEGDPILLADQNRSRWDRVAIERGLDALAHAERLLGDHGPGPYALQAAIAACHARAPTAPDTDWRRIVRLYDALAQLTGSPVVELNRAVAIGMADGPAAALPIVERLAAHPAMARYHWLPSVEGDLLEKLGRREEARRAYDRAADLAGNAREKALLRSRSQAMREHP